MTENITVTPGSGEVVAADQVIDPDLGTVKEQVIKLADGRTGGTNRWKINNDNSGDVTVVSSVLPTGASTSANQSTELTRIGDVTEAAPATDTASSGLNGRLQRIAQRITSFIALIPSALTGSGNFKVAVVETTVTQPVSGTVTANAGTNLNTSTLALETGGNLASAKSDLDTLVSHSPVLGQALSAASTPVVLPAIQITTLTPPAAITNFANESGGHLATIDTTLTEISDDIDAIETSVGRIPAQGQALAAASLPVVLTAIQVSTLTPPAALTNFANETGGNLDAIKADLDTINTNIAEISADTDTIETNSTTIAGAITASKMATTAADGDYITFGAKADAAVTDVTTTNTFMGFFKGLLSLTGVLTETAPAIDTASSGLNGRLQRIAQRISSLIALIPTALGQGTMAQSFKVVLPSDQSAIPASQSGTWSTRTQDGSGTAITSTGSALDINIKSGNPTSITANAGTNLNTSALALEAGHLATIDTSSSASSTVEGAIADAIVAAGATGTISAKLRRVTQGLEDLKTLIVLAAGSAIIGKVGIDQTTPGTTNAVQPVNKEVYGTATAFTITLNSLANGSGRQSTLLTSNTNKRALIHVSVKTGTSPTANTTIDVYLIRSDGTYADDSAGASDAAITVINSVLLGSIVNNSASSNLTYVKSFDTQVVGSLGSSWGIAIVNNTGVALNAANNNATYELIS